MGRVWAVRPAGLWARPGDGATWLSEIFQTAPPPLPIPYRHSGGPGAWGMGLGAVLLG